MLILLKAIYFKIKKNYIGKIRKKEGFEGGQQLMKANFGKGLGKKEGNLQNKNGGKIEIPFS
jgi:hypothetical protein